MREESSMSAYTVSEISLAPIPGVHGGTGQQQSYNYAVDPSSVLGSGKLEFVAQQQQARTMLFELNDLNAVPNWFGVAVPTGITDFTRPHLFFHPLPGQPRDSKGQQLYKDSDYKTKSGGWPQLFYYMERLGYQLDGVARGQILIMPFLTNAATDTGILPTNWKDIFTHILTLVRAEMEQDDGSLLQISQLVVSSFSVGIVYSDYFRSHAPDVVGGLGLLAEVWDFDGWFSDHAYLSKKLVGTSQYGVIKYDQDPSTGALNFHVPTPRWANYAAPPTAATQSHALIRDYMFLHSAVISNVGAVIQPASPPQAPGSPPESPAAPPAPPPVVPGTPLAPGILVVPSTPVPGTPMMPGTPAVPRIRPPPGRPPHVTPPSVVIPPGSPRLPMPSSPPSTPTISDGCSCNCCAAICGMVAAVGTTATTTITAITAIAAVKKLS
jgi:hypothetical protein